jgi:hypothetical protein
MELGDRAEACPGWTRVAKGPDLRSDPRPMPQHNQKGIQDSPPRVFSQVGVLLSRPDLWGGWLDGRPDRAGLFKDAFSCVVRISSHTGWLAEAVLKRLGCETKTEEQLSELTESRLRSCLEYMLWVESLLVDLDLAIDKRLTVQGAARFFVIAERDLARVEAAMEEGDFSAAEYLRIGEVAAAWECAVRFLPGAVADRVRRVRAENPLIDDSTPHMSPMRLEMLNRENASQLLGDRVEARMREHLDLCHVCAGSLRRAGSLRTDDRLIAR